jgi:hypothetical protein
MTHTVRVKGEKIASYNCKQVAFNHAYDIMKDYEEIGIINEADITIDGKPIKSYIY